MRYQTCFFIMVFVTASACARAEALVVTEEQAIAYAMRDNKDIAIQAQEVVGAQSRITQEQAGFWPSVTASGGWNDTRGLYGKDVGAGYAQASLKLPLYRGGKTKYMVRSAQAYARSQEAVLERVSLDVTLRVRQAFYALMLARQACILNKDIVENARAHVRVVRQRSKSGFASHKELLAAQSYYTSVRRAYIETAGQETVLEGLLQALLYISPGTELVLRGAMPCALKPVSYTSACAQALIHRPELIAADADIETARAAFESVRAGSRPEVIAGFDYYTRSHAAVGTAKNPNDYTVAGFALSWPVFDGWLTQSKLKQAASELTARSLTRQKTAQDIAYELQDACSRMRTAAISLKAARAQSMVYYEAVRRVAAQFRAGEASSLEMDDAWLQYAVARFSINEAYYQWRSAYIAYTRAVGKK